MLFNEEKTEIDYKPKSFFVVMNNISFQITFPSNKTSIDLINYGIMGSLDNTEDVRYFVKTIVNK